MAYCRNHPDRTAVNTCHQCGDWLCEECTVEINGRIFCRKCLAQLAGTPTPAAPPPPPSPYPPHVAFRAPASRGRYISGAMLALLTVFLPIPGVNYMYEGLIKRGLVAMGGFFFLIFLIIFTGSGLGDPFWPLSLALSLTLPVYWLACLFDSLRVRRQINAGEAVKDEIDDMILFVKSHKRLIIGLMAVLVAMSVISFIVTSFAHPLQQLLPYIVVGFGLYVLFSRPKRGGGSKSEDIDDNKAE